MKEEKLQTRRDGGKGRKEGGGGSLHFRRRKTPDESLHRFQIPGFKSLNWRTNVGVNLYLLGKWL